MELRGESEGIFLGKTAGKGAKCVPWKGQWLEQTHRSFPWLGIWPWRVGPSPEEHREGSGGFQTPANGTGCGLSLRIPFSSAHWRQICLPVQGHVVESHLHGWLEEEIDGCAPQPHWQGCGEGRLFSHIPTQPLRGHQFPPSTGMILLLHNKSFQGGTGVTKAVARGLQGT